MYKFEKDTTADCIKDNIMNNDVEVISIDCISNENATFIVKVRVSDLTLVLNPEFWPSGVHVRQFCTAKQVITNNVEYKLKSIVLCFVLSKFCFLINVLQQSLNYVHEHFMNGSSTYPDF